MKSLLVISKIKVENANAISGLTYGMPAMTHFLGFVHAISREIKEQHGIALSACGIVSHRHQTHAYKKDNAREYVFSLTRNPLTKEGKTSSFNEEGRISFEISLVIECDFNGDDFSFDSENPKNNQELFACYIYNLAIKKRLAGGIITDISSVDFLEGTCEEQEIHKQRRLLNRRLMPGFVLLDRSQILKDYLSKHSELNPLDALLDFYTLKYKAEKVQEDTDPKKECTWKYLPKPKQGWFVPIQIGYKAISKIYTPGEVARTRDAVTPFVFTEPVYSLGEWMGFHRIRDIQSMMWRYEVNKNLYVCSNKNIKEVL